MDSLTTQSPDDTSLTKRETKHPGIYSGVYNSTAYSSQPKG